MNRSLRMRGSAAKRVARGEVQVAENPEGHNNTAQGSEVLGRPSVAGLIGCDSAIRG